MSEISPLRPLPRFISCVGAGPVRTYQPPAREPDWQVSDPACFSRWPGSFARFDQKSSSWRTFQRLLVGGFQPYSGRWPLSGMMRGGEVCEHRRWAHHTDGNDGSVSVGWPTAAKWDGHDSLLTLSKEGWMCRAVKWRRKNVKGVPNIQYPLAVAVRFNLVRSDVMALVDKHSKTDPVIPDHFYLDGKQQLNPTWVESLMNFPEGWTLPDGPPLRGNSSHGKHHDCTTHQADDTSEIPESPHSVIQSSPPVLN